MKTSHATEHGAALIEVLVGTVIFMLATLGLSSSTVSAKRAADSSRHAAEATTLAFDKLEQLRTLTPTDSALSAGSHTDSPSPMSVTGAAGGIFTRSWTVTTSLPSLTPTVTTTALGRVTMRVTWPTTNGTGSVTLVSYYKLT